MTIDCLIIGFNDFDFETTVQTIRGNDPTSGGYRDINLAFIEMDGRKYRAMDLLDEINHDRLGPLHNADFMWPVVLYLGSYLKRHGHSFDYINLFQQEKDLLRTKLQSGTVRTIAITTTLYVMPQPILEIVSFIRQYDDEVQIIIGGPYISAQAAMMDDATLRDHFAYLGGDIYVISSEGEKALSQTLHALKDGRILEGIDNIAFRTNAGFTLNTRSIERNMLEENPVDYALFPTQQFGEFLSIRTAKSCPFSCAFCGFPNRAGKYTYLDLSHVERELDAIAEVGTITTLTFLDDTFNVPKKRFREILQLMIDKDYGFKWNSFYRSDHGDEATIDLMKRAGCEGVFLGVESGSDTILEKMNKKSRRKDYLSAIKHLRDRDILTYASLIIGFPGETDATVQESISFLEESQSDFYRAQLWYCDPMTPVWDHKAELGIKNFAFNWTHNTMDCHQASAYVEDMFLNVSSSIWLPQQGFELWSLFYLQRKGFSRAQIKHFLTAFNDAIREKLLLGDQTPVSESLRENIRFWGTLGTDNTPIGSKDFAPLYCPTRRQQGNTLQSTDSLEQFSF